MGGIAGSSVPNPAYDAGLDQASRAYLVGHVGARQRGREGLLRLAFHRRGDADPGLFGQRARTADQRRLQLATQRRQAVQLRAGRVRLRLAQVLGELEELLHQLALVAPQQVDEPGALRWTPQLAQRPSERSLLFGPRFADLLVTRGSEGLRPQRVQLVGDLVELARVICGFRR